MAFWLRSLGIACLGFSGFEFRFLGLGCLGFFGFGFSVFLV